MSKDGRGLAVDSSGNPRLCTSDPPRQAPRPPREPVRQTARAVTASSDGISESGAAGVRGGIASRKRRGCDTALRVVPSPGQGEVKNPCLRILPGDRWILGPLVQPRCHLGRHFRSGNASSPPGIFHSAGKVRASQHACHPGRLPRRTGRQTLTRAHAMETRE